MLGTDCISHMVCLTVTIVACVFLAYHMTDPHIIRACDLGNVVRAHCCVYSAAFCGYAIQSLLVVVVKQTDIVRSVMWAVSVAQILMSVSTTAGLLCISASQSHRALQLPACRHALRGSWLAFAWYTHVPLDAACMVFYLYGVYVYFIE